MWIYSTTEHAISAQYVSYGTAVHDCIVQYYVLYHTVYCTILCTVPYCVLYHTVNCKLYHTVPLQTIALVTVTDDARRVWRLSYGTANCPPYPPLVHHLHTYIA